MTLTREQRLQSIAEVARRHDALTTAEVARAAGMTGDLLTRWACRDVIHPSVRKARGPGSLRLWSLSDVVAVRALRALGPFVSWLEAGAAVWPIQRTPLDGLRGMALVVAPDEGSYLVPVPALAMEATRTKPWLLVALDPLLHDLGRSSSPGWTQRVEEQEPGVDFARPAPGSDHLKEKPCEQ